MAHDVPCGTDCATPGTVCHMTTSTEPVPEPAPEPRTVIVRFRTTPKGAAELDRLASLHGHRDRSAYLRALVKADSTRHPR